MGLRPCWALLPQACILPRETVFQPCITSKAAATPGFSSTMNNVPEFFQREVLDKSAQKPVLVDFWAEWCGPCRILGPVLEKLARESKGAWRLVKINTDRQPVLSQQYGVRGIPAVKLFRNGQVQAEFTGALPEHAVRRWLDEHLAAVQ